MKQGLEDVFQCVRDGYAAALGALLALGLNPESQVNISGRQSISVDVIWSLSFEIIVLVTADCSKLILNSCPHCYEIIAM